MTDWDLARQLGQAVWIQHLPAILQELSRVGRLLHFTGSEVVLSGLERAPATASGRGILNYRVDAQFLLLLEKRGP